MPDLYYKKSEKIKRLTKYDSDYTMQKRERQNGECSYEEKSSDF
jgi:hypothetical protein